MMRSLYSGISGLRNHQTRMDVIGNNISNVNTAGYKTSRVIFQDIFSQNVAAGMANTGNLGGTNPMQIGLGIRLSNVDVIHTRAAFGRTDKETDMMINGDGFFIVMQTNPQTGEDEYLYTRAGNFDIDSEGYLVTSHGYFVMGYTVDPMMGMVYPGQEAVAPQAPIAEGANVPAQTRIPAGSFRNTTTGNITIPANYLGTGEPAVPEVVPPGGTWPATDLVTTVEGPALFAIKRIPAQEARDPIFGLVPSGNPEPGDLQKIRVVSNVFQNVNWWALPAADRDAIQIQIDIISAEEATDDPDMEVIQAAQDAINGILTNAGNLQAFPQYEVSLPGFMTAPNGDVSVIVANRAIVIGRIALAMFANPTGLDKAGNSLYRESASSGPVVVTEANADGAGKIDAGGLEMSNVDLADQFTDMIVTQRGFQANSRIITVSDTMLEELVNLKR